MSVKVGNETNAGSVKREKEPSTLKGLRYRLDTQSEGKRRECQQRENALGELIAQA
jgi:hypothetical protein